MLTAKKIEAINLLMQGMTKDAVSKQIGISPKTLWEWGKESEWKAEYDSQLRRKFEDINPAIINRLFQIAYSNNENAAVAACKELLSRGGLASVQKIETEGFNFIVRFEDEEGDAN